VILSHNSVFREWNVSTFRRSDFVGIFVWWSKGVLIHMFCNLFARGGSYKLEFILSSVLEIEVFIFVVS